MNESTHQYRVIDAIIKGEYATIDASAIGELQSDLNKLSKSEAESYFHPKEEQSFLSGIINFYQQNPQLGLKALNVFQTWLREKDITYTWVKMISIVSMVLCVYRQKIIYRLCKHLIFLTSNPVTHLKIIT